MQNMILTYPYVWHTYIIMGGLALPPSGADYRCAAVLLKSSDDIMSCLCPHASYPNVGFTRVNIVATEATHEACQNLSEPGTSGWAEEFPPTFAAIKIMGPSRAYKRLAFVGRYEAGVSKLINCS